MRTALALLASTLLLATTAEAQNSPPIADAGADQDMFLTESTVLNGSATDPDGDAIVAWQWLIVSLPLGSSPSFGPTTSPTPIFTPDMLGDYVFSLRASDGQSVSLPDEVTVHVAENLPPVAVATADVTSGPAPLTVSFDGSGSFDPEGGPLLVDWSFGDGSPPSAALSPTHVFTWPGSYVVLLSVIDGWGQRDEDTVLITVTPATNNPPVASPSATPNSGSAPLAVQFAANAFDPDGDPLSYAWDFGDPSSADNSSTLADPAHSYAQAGAYVAWLTVDDGADSVTASLTIVVDSLLFLSVKSARIKWKKQDHTSAKVQLEADFNPGLPGPDDLIRVALDGTPLFAVPFSAFILAGHDDEDDDQDSDGEDDDANPTKYKLKQKDLKVEFDIGKGRIEIRAKKAELSSLDDFNGVDVELQIGSAVAVENIPMTGSDEKLRYERNDGD